MPVVTDRTGPRPVPSSGPSTPTSPAAPAAPAAVSGPQVIGTPDAYEAQQPGAPRTLETVFTPGNAALELELGSIDAVVAARRADPKTYSATENPYRIEYAIYNMTDKTVINRLIDASRAGVQVQVLIDAGQIGPEKPFNTVVKDLVAGGFTHAETQKGLSAEERLTKNIVEIDMPGDALFHFKARYFSYPDPATGAPRETLLTGSHNPQNSAHKNDESLHRISDPAVVKKYTDAMHALRDDKPIQNEWDPGAAVNVLFSSALTKGPKPVDQIFQLIDQEQELVFISVFALRNLEASDRSRLVDKLAAAHARGVPVVVMADRKQTDGIDPAREPGKPSHSVSDTVDEELEARGITVYEFMNPSGPRTAMHLKSAVFGLTDIKVVTDTGNWTQATMGSGGASRGRNAESLLFVDSGQHDGNKTGMTYLAEYLRVMRRYAGQDQGSPKTPVEETIAKLQALPGWPKVKVDLDLLARGHEGKEVYLVGEHPALKGASAGEPGLKLDTDSGTATFRAKASVELPLGLALSYRVVSRDAQGRVEVPPGASLVVVDPPVGSDPTRVTVQEG